MKKYKNLVFLCAVTLLFSISLLSYAEEEVQGIAQLVSPSDVNDWATITIDVKDADINNVLRAIALKSGVNIVVGKEVQATVSMRLVGVPWEKALDTLLKTYGFGYERDGNIITVTTLEKLSELRQANANLADIEPLLSKVYNLKYLDAADVKDVVKSQLSPRGTIEVVQQKGQKGWEFGTTTKGEGFAKAKRTGKEASVRSKTLVVSDVRAALEKVGNVIKEIDVMAKQILIEARIMEVNRDILKDIGFEWGTGADGNSAIAVQTVNDTGRTISQITATQQTAQTPSIFTPESSGISPTNTGLAITYAKIAGTQFNVAMHALEEDVDTNTLSAPKILTIDNQEATILVGTKYPILKSETESGVVTVTLDYYQDIGIQLNVVPQVSDDNYINMIIHPAVSSFTSTVGDNAYPIITVREAETQLLMNDGDTIVMGGLLKDVKSEGKFKVPILGNIPLLGVFFQRKTNDTEKIELLIFITARIIDNAMGEAQAPTQ